MRTTIPDELDGDLIRALESYRPVLTRFAVWLTRDRTVAEDLVQETMLRAWRSRSSLRDKDALRAWLFTIVRREYARLHERKQLPVADVDVFALHEGDDAPASYDEDPQISELRRAILTLSDEYRIPLVMQVLGGFTTAEIAQEMELTIPAVLTRLFRARNQLRELYGAPPGRRKHHTGPGSA